VVERRSACGFEALPLAREDDAIPAKPGRTSWKPRSSRARFKKFLSLPPFGRCFQGKMRPEPISEGFPAMAKQPSEHIAEASAEALTRGGQAAEKIMKGNADALAETGHASRAALALTESGNASRAAVQELAKAYQELASKNAKNLTAAMQALAAVKSPTEFIELQQRLIKEGVEAAVSDSQHIAQLTTAVFTAAFEPVKKQIEALQKTAQS